MSENMILQNEENAILATFDITTENTAIRFIDLTNMTNIDWGDGTVNSELSHTYIEIGQYVCKIYGVTSIGKSAFRGFDSLTNIEIPDSVTSMGSFVFENCSGLTSVVIGDGVTSIGYEAFDGCYKLRNVVIGNSVTSIGYMAFGHCNKLTTVNIPDSVTSIDEYAFIGCQHLMDITIPNGVTSIGHRAFMHCASLVIYCEVKTKPSGWGDALYSWNEDNCPVVWDCNNNEKANNGCVYTTIHNIRYALKNNIATLTRQSIDIEGVIQIPSEFYYKDRIYSISSIDDYTFAGCDSLTSVVIPDSVTSIGYCAFDGCYRLTSVVIGDSVTSIGENAFRGCGQLSQVYFKNPTPISAQKLSDSSFPLWYTTYYVPIDSLQTYKTAWSNTLYDERIQPYNFDPFISLEGLKTYHTMAKEEMQRYVQQYIHDNFATLMAEYLATESNAPTAADIGTVFEEEEA